MIKDPERGDVLKIEEAGSHGGHGRPGLEAYVIEVDEQKGTYKVTPVDPATVEPPEWRLDPQAYPGSTHQPPVLIPASYVGLYRVAIVSYWAGLTVVTMDQANLHLAATKNLLYWTGDTTAGRVLNGTAGRDIFAANPSPAGTRWFVNNIQDGGIA